MPRNEKSLIDRAVDTAGTTVDAAIPVIESAMEQVRDLGKDAAAQAKDLATDTKTKTAPLVAEIAGATKEVAVPKAKAAAAAGVATAAGLAAAGKELAAAKVAEAKGEPQKKRSKLRTVLIFGTLAAVAGFAYNKLRPKPEADNWQSAYTPPESSAATTSSTTSATGAAMTGGAHLAPGVGPDGPIATDDPMVKRAAEEGTLGDDPGGAAPDEAIADAVEEPRDPTTPDDPAEVVEVEPEATRKES